MEEDYKFGDEKENNDGLSGLLKHFDAKNGESNQITENDVSILLGLVSQLQQSISDGDITAITSILDEFNQALVYNPEKVAKILDFDEFYSEIAKSLVTLTGTEDVLQIFRLSYNILISLPNRQEFFSSIFESAINECQNTEITEIYSWCSKLIFAFISNVEDNQDNLDVLEIRNAAIQCLDFSEEEIENGSKIYEYIIKHCNPKILKYMMFKDFRDFILHENLSQTAMLRILNAIIMYLSNYPDGLQEFDRNNLFPVIRDRFLDTKSQEGEFECDIILLQSYLRLVDNLINISDGNTGRMYYELADLPQFNYFFTEYDESKEGIIGILLQIHSRAINNMKSDRNFSQQVLSNIPLEDIMNIQGLFTMKCIIVKFISVYARNFQQLVEPQNFYNFLLEYSEFLEEVDCETDHLISYLTILHIVLNNLQKDEFRETYINDLVENGIYEKLMDLYYDASDSVVEYVGIVLKYFPEEDEEDKP
ncbi:hypothetical protein TVAG_432910 [Trichomonas vaginalis G3]|uniref:SPIN90/Ldb17 leucine-rich domain-containing protein n=1 Tax=Trichomonas vaginalis (strain ATCC PRA-98 / G3) TaxID=412133 RepID=A2DIT2_TRIV3|nr:armadillo (ARM) repeat-containing protein family [Trichomonas vaginalis G3]EAY19695.1 hypothetical protein TVAG_432910 [Trichomonas vaginalis G3]KAI5521285.1 armadillo (ARM) repeat-containing protein family [Trichomonas vaginalis G3]|eukprot:XP_001580681.1 hypothetical protein [Trichomonas vaginalis G3]